MEKLTDIQKKILDGFITENYELFIGVAKKVVKNRNDAEEVVQKTLVYIIQKIVEEKDIHNLVGYTVIAIRCRAYNYIRDNSRVLTFEDLENVQIRQKF